MPTNNIAVSTIILVFISKMVKGCHRFCLWHPNFSLFIYWRSVSDANCVNCVNDVIRDQSHEFVHSLISPE